MAIGTTDITKLYSDSGGLTDISGLLETLTGEYKRTRAEREKRYEQGLATMQQVAGLMAGPEFDKYAEQLYESAKRKAVGAGTSRLISAGLMGTTRAGEPERAFEREIGTPFRLGLAEQRAGRIGDALTRVADYMKTFPDIYPEAGTLAYLATGGFGALTPEQKMAMQQLPYLMEASQRAGSAGGSTFMQPAGSAGGVGGIGTAGGASGGGAGYSGLPSGSYQPLIGGGGGSYGAGEGGFAPSGQVISGGNLLGGWEYTPGTYTYPTESELESGISEFMGWGQEPGWMQEGGEWTPELADRLSAAAAGVPTTGGATTPIGTKLPFQEFSEAGAARVIKRPHPVTGELIRADDPVFQQYEMSYLPTGGTKWTRKPGVRPGVSGSW